MDMASRAKAVEIPNEAGQSVWWSNGSVITIKLGTDTSNGTMTLSEQMCPPGYATPLHTHHEHDEMLLAREGNIDIYYQDDNNNLEVVHTTPGDAVFLEKGKPHGFHNTADEPTGLYILFESPLEMGFLEAGTEVDTPAGILPEAPQEILESQQLSTMSEEYATEIVKPLPIDE